MIQQINLYQPIFRKQEKVFSAKTMAQAAGLLLAGLVLFYGYVSWETSVLGEQAEQMQVQREDRVQRLARLAQAFPERVRSLELEREVAALQDEVQRKEQLLSRLSETSAGNRAGFVSHLEGLARRRPDGLWLTRVNIIDGGTGMRLDGAAYRPERVPQYLQKLTAEPAFHGIEFSHFRLARPDETNGRVDFVVATDAEEDGS